MTPRFVGTLILVMIAACLLAGVLVYPHLPMLVASHWDAAGHANGHSPRLAGVLILPAIMLALFALWAYLPKLDPLAPRFATTRQAYDFAWFLIEALLAALYALMLLVALGALADPLRYLMLLLGGFFLALGTILPRIPRNWFVGIRTPWSLSSDEVWAKTHQFGGRLFVIAGAVILAAGGIRLPHSAALMLAAILAAALASVVYSYLEFRKGI